MSLLLAGEIYAAWFFLSALFVLVSFTTWDWLRDMDAQRRMSALIAVEAARTAEDSEVALLDALYALPARRHP